MREYYELRESFQKHKNLYRLKEYKEILNKIDFLLSDKEEAKFKMLDLMKLEDLKLDVEIEIEKGPKPIRSTHNPIKKITPSPTPPKTIQTTDFDILITDIKNQLNLLYKIKDEVIKYTLQHTNYNKTKTAEILGINVRTLRNWLTEDKLNEYKQSYH